MVYNRVASNKNEPDQNIYFMLMLRRHFCSSLNQVLLCCLLAIRFDPLYAAEPDSQTPVQAATPQADPLCKFPPVRGKALIDPNLPPNRTQLQADEADLSQNSTTRFRGSVVIQRDKRLIEADEAEYSQKTEDFDAKGNVRFLARDIEIEADKAKMNLKNNQGTLQQTRYRTLPENARGTAETMTLAGPSVIVMDEATFSTCPPDSTDWELSASKITLDSESRQGTANNAVISFKGVPFLYTPYLRFPLGDERMSGFLFPDFSISDRRGTEIFIPYYWNIDPQVDATITAHNMTRRGLMWENEFRYLTEQSKGEIEFDYLEDDKVYGDTRQRVKWKHQAQAGAGWSSTLDVYKVSDNDHLKDFADDISQESLSHLEQLATLSYNAPYWQFTALAQDYQSLTDSHPYRKLPQLTLNSRLPNEDNQLNFDVSTEWVRFDHRDKSQVRAERAHIQPTLSLPLRNQAAFFVPRVTRHITQYELSDNAGQENKSPSRSITVSSLDTGIFLERETQFGDTPLVQTFEPRLFYVYAPYVDQGDLPIFESGPTDFTFSSLFRENRFTGIDRIGDTNQLTVALTSRFLHELSGAELFSASVGRVYYYEDRRVALPGGGEETENNSDYLGRLSMRTGAYWTLSSDIRWDEDTQHTVYRTNRLTYNRDHDHLFTVGNRYRRNELKTQDIGLVWRISPRWRVLGAYQYDVLNDRPTETIYGLNYDSCCWGLRFLAREYYNGQINGQDDYERAFYLVLELKGLSSFGNQDQAESILQQSIPGYTR